MALTDINKAIQIIERLTRENNRYKGFLSAAAVIILLGFGFFLLDERKDDEKIKAQSALISNLNHLYTEIDLINKALADSVYKTAAQRDSIYVLMQDYSERYFAASNALDQKDEIIQAQEKVIYSLKHHKRESKKQMEMLAARYEKKYSDLQKSLENRYANKNYDSVYQFKILEDGTKIERVVEKKKGVRASYSGDYLSFIDAVPSSKYMLTVYQMSSAMPHSLRQGSTINGRVVVNVAKFFYENDIKPPFVIELTHDEEIVWQYKAIDKFPHGALASDIEPKTRKHIYSTNGTRGNSESDAD